MTTQIADTAEKPKYELVKISSIEKTVQELVKRYHNIHYDVTTTKGMELARKDRAELRSHRTALETARKEEKADVLERGRYIDAKAKSIGEVIAKYEEPLDEMIKAEEDRKEKEKQAKLEADRQRIANIQAKIAKIQGAPAEAMFYPSEKIAQGITNLLSIAIDDSFGEYKSLAETAKSEALAKLQEIHDKKKAEEEEAERLRLEREEFERQKAVEEERRKQEEADAAAKRATEEAKLKAEREEHERKMAEERAELERQRQAQEAELSAQRAEQERIDREKRESEEAKARAEKEEADRLQREKDEAERKAAEERAAAAEKQREETEKARRAEAKARKLAEAKMASATDALKSILAIAQDNTRNETQSLAEIAVIAEANIG